MSLLDVVMILNIVFIWRVRTAVYFGMAERQMLIAHGVGN